MLLREMFSPVGGEKDDDSEVDWIDDLKFFIDNNNSILEKFIFPAILRHKKYQGHPSAYKLYIKPISQCVDVYCQKYDVTERDKKFPPEAIEKLARDFAEKQDRFIAQGDYA